MNNKSAEVKDLQTTLTLLEKAGITVINTSGTLIGSYLGGEVQGSDSKTIIFGDGAAFVQYINEVCNEKIVLRGRIIFKDLKICENGSWSLDYLFKEDDALAFFENPRAQVYFIPKYDKQQPKKTKS